MPGIGLEIRDTLRILRILRNKTILYEWRINKWPRWQNINPLSATVFLIGSLHDINLCFGSQLTHRTYRCVASDKAAAPFLQ